MKKVLLLIIALVVACSAAMAAPVDMATARSKAVQCIQREMAGGRLLSTGSTDATLIKTEMGEKSMMPVFYIFNGANTFIIVSGDDRAEEILAVGDAPLQDIDNMPDNMRLYKRGAPNYGGDPLFFLVRRCLTKVGLSRTDSFQPQKIHAFA